MYDLTISLDYGEPLKLKPDYRYDFVTFDINNDHGRGLLNNSVFVLRTITGGNVKGNVLIDLIHTSNVNAFDVASHANCHFHLLESDKLREEGILINDKINLQITETSVSSQYFAEIKDQAVTNNSPFGDNTKLTFTTCRYILFTLHHENTVNSKNIELATIFDLQKEHIWHNNRYRNFNNLHTLDIDRYVNRKLAPSTPWSEVKKIIESENKKWRDLSNQKFNQLLDKRGELPFLVIER
ncbi:MULTISPECIES: hypothetical protein [Paenibacillus]|uniref:Uncharacterized protein n=1 Tax=Paenibacillus odorifer TaxID=189426 RepID=A0A1R0X327_9BACL|nr:MULTISPECIES: hypothetical protein [Paenibacillus]ETT61193.1 hypothetical protein C171_13135 [Paenibacillus sp. FSL H8-237]MEC0134725.1 hypothetical protein [Paenibacillus odorifer]MEC0221918.1 hypothetical protein [Paenibacillus odorifer]OMD26477.1 hypothetical protein BJP48_22865 [Paenibacillus odorifer]OMD27684.1 hypothetical protein BJP51_24520 [Paenibacillus odorifer]